jgi:hypothetical protein
MDVSTIANLINASAVSAGVIFAAAQIRQYERRRRRDAMIELVRSFQNPSFANAFRRVISLPDNATKAQVSEILGPDGEDAVHIVGFTWESLGVLVFRREITLDLVDDFFSGPITVSWRKLSHYVSEQRSLLQRDTAFEWFQWLSERIIEREKQTPPVPAYVTHGKWK